MQKTDMEKMVIERANRLASLYAKSVVDEVKQSNEYADEMLGSFSLEDLSAGLYRVYGMQMGKWNAKQPERVNEVIALLNNDPVKYKSAVILQTQRLMSAANIVPVNSSNIVDVLTTSGYGIASVGSNAKSKLQELEKTIQLPVRKGGYTAFAVVEKEGKALGAMGVVNGEIDTSTCPVEEIAVQTQMIPITKIAKFLAEVIKFEDKKGISMIAVSDNVLATTGLGAIVKPNFANFMLVKDALLGVYAYLGRDVPLKTMNGEKTAGELENVLTQLYITHFKIIKNGDISAYEVTRRFEVAVSSYMALNKHPGSFEVKLNNKTQGLYFSLSLPTIALPKYILSKEYFSGASEAQAVEMKLVTTNHRGENYHKNSAGTRTMAAPFPIGKTLFEASKIRTDLELYIKLHTRIRLLLEGVEKKNDYVLHFLNALRMMGFSGTLYLDDNAKSHNAVSSVHDSTEVKYDSGVKKAKFGDAAFTVEFIHNLSSAAVPDHTGTVVYKWYGLNSTSRGKWLASYDGTRKTMNTTAYGPSFALTVFLTANELTIAEDTSQVLIASIAKHDLMGYRICNSEYEMAYAQAMKQGQAVKEKLPMLIKTERDMGNYYVESILQNVLRTQYPYTAVGYKEAYAYYEMPRQVLNLNGSVCIKPRKARVDNQDILEFAGNKARANNMIKIEGDEEIVKHNVNIVPPVLAPVVPLTVPTAVRMEPTAPPLPIPVNLNVPTVANVVPGPLHQVHVVPKPVLAPVVPGPNLTADPVPVMDDRPVRTGNPQPLRAVFDDESDD